ncbi:MAG: hypothetical protein CMJ85_02125 [Planctomycetes bacterium]|jgi:hypothetical protein|nr:hypothetical protein [Planctomycetota bacterium]
MTSKRVQVVLIKKIIKMILPLLEAGELTDKHGQKPVDEITEGLKHVSNGGAVDPTLISALRKVTR